MKQLRLNVFILTWICVLSCTRTAVPAVDNVTWVTAIDDRTDPRMLRLAADPIISLYRFPVAVSQEAYFRFTTISDRRLNPYVEYHLANGFTTEKENKLEDPEYREKLIVLFYAKIRNILADYHRQYDSTSSLPFSECYRTIANELTLLAKSRATNKYLIVHSDLREKSDFFDCYTADGTQLMRINQQQIASTFLKASPLLANLSGITVIFIFSARSRDEECQFLEMVEVYKLLLLPRHTKIIVQASNNYFNL